MGQKLETAAEVCYIAVTVSRTGVKDQRYEFFAFLFHIIFLSFIWILTDFIYYIAIVNENLMNYESNTQ